MYKKIIMYGFLGYIIVLPFLMLRIFVFFFMAINGMRRLSKGKAITPIKPTHIFHYDNYRHHYAIGVLLWLMILRTLLH